MRGGGVVLAGGLALVVFVGIAAAGPPLVSAGLDQDVVQGDPVYLDAGGTHVPDGELAGLEWSIEAPHGTEFAPSCADCEVTSFKPSSVGQYAVTLTATSESGIERSDTLYVTVAAYNPEPEREQRQEPNGNSAVETSGNGNNDTQGDGEGRRPAPPPDWGSCLGDTTWEEMQNRGVCNGANVARDISTVVKDGDVVGYKVPTLDMADDYPDAEPTEDGDAYIIPADSFGGGSPSGGAGETGSNREFDTTDGSIGSNDGGAGGSGNDSTQDYDADSCNNVPTSYCYELTTDL